MKQPLKKKSEAKITVGLESQKITTSLSKQGPGMTTNEKSIEKREKRKESEKVTIDDSPVTQHSNGQGKPFKRNADIHKTNGEVKDTNGIETANKFECSMEVAECTKEGGYKEVKPNILVIS